MSLILSKNDQLALLRDLRDQVWGNKSIFKQQITSLAGTGEFLEFGRHFLAVQLICEPLLQSEVDRLFIFKEYQKAMEEFQQNDYPYERGACITGQPGIGKSTFVAYAVIECLRNRQPVAVQYATDRGCNDYILFHAQGVGFHPVSHRLHSTQSGAPIWAFSDSRPHSLAPTLAFTCGVGVRVFQTTFPAKERWYQWTKECGVLPYVLSLPSIEELRSFAHVMGVDPEKMAAFAEKWGCVPQTLLNLLNNPRFEAFHQSATMESAERIAGDVFAALHAVDCKYLIGFETSASIFFIEPKNDEEHAISKTIVPTDWIAAILGNALLKKSLAEQIQFFDTMSHHHFACVTAGWLFESFIKYFLCQGGKFMMIHWKDTGPMAEHQETFTLPQCNMYHMAQDLTQPPPFYWHPPSGTCLGINGALVSAGHVLVIQLSVSGTHKSPQPGVDKLWSLCPKKLKYLGWKLLFICPTERVTGLANAYANNLLYGDEKPSESSRKKRKKVRRQHLQVGYAIVNLHGNSGGFMYTASVNLIRKNDDDSKEIASTSGAGLAVPQVAE